MGSFGWVLLLSVVASILYTIVILAFVSGWKSLKETFTQMSEVSEGISIIIPTRNESSNISKCLESVLNQKTTFSNYEVIVVDNHSKDNTTEIVRSWSNKIQRVKLLVCAENQRGKKAALELGISEARYNRIIITDADTNRGELWLQSFAEAFEQSPSQLIVGPVTLKSDKRRFSIFQEVEFHSLAASTAGAVGLGHPIMANAANMAFTRDIYTAFDDPFRRDILSGDDVFLLHQCKQRFPENIVYLKNQAALVTIRPVATVKKFIAQRARWTSKAKHYNDGDTMFTGAVVLGLSVALFFNMLFMLFKIRFLKSFLFAFAVKNVVDAFLIHRTKDFFKVSPKWHLIPVFEVAYPVYVMWSTILGYFNRKW